jgi:hypothetical protein
LRAILLYFDDELGKHKEVLENFEPFAKTSSPEKKAAYLPLLVLFTLSSV